MLGCWSSLRVAPVPGLTARLGQRLPLRLAGFQKDQGEA
jgi:hypothetical protein